ncbi:universal stress protein [Paenarthrobacter sp. NPDC058040]|uniref:universal stress protein n=1 Tax=unclassified Paenarthrobacter TaxID=2634190 RepID=UPI0036DCC00F
MSENLIVVGVDGSESALKAAKVAHALAGALGASLHVVTAFDSDRVQVASSGSETWVHSDADSAEGVAKAVAATLQQLAPEQTVRYTAARGKPAEALINVAERYQATMIVVGNRRMQGLGRVLGSVANSVAHNAPCDVYIAKTH